MYFDSEIIYIDSNICLFIRMGCLSSKPKLVEMLGLEVVQKVAEVKEVAQVAQVAQEVAEVQKVAQEVTEVAKIQEVVQNITDATETAVAMTTDISKKEVDLEKIEKTKEAITHQVKLAVGILSDN